MKKSRFILFLFVLNMLCGQVVSAQFLGGTGNGMAVNALANVDPCSYFYGDSAAGFTALELPNPDPCSYYVGDTVAGFSVDHLLNPDSCAFFFGDTLSGYSATTLANPDSCGLYEGTVADGFAMFFAPSTVACPTFYGTTADGFATATSACLPLEVTATNLQGRMEGQNAYLWWHTHAEVNNLGFWLQRSEDLLHWEQVAFMEGADRSNTLRNYTHTDEQKPLGVSYYRWIQADLDGSTTQSNVVALLKLNDALNRELLVYPVPVQQGDQLHLAYVASDSGQVSMQAVDLHGKVLWEQTKFKVEQNIMLNFHTGRFAAGVYLLVLEHGGRRMTKRFFVH